MIPMHVVVLGQHRKLKSTADDQRENTDWHLWYLEVFFYKCIPFKIGIKIDRDSYHQILAKINKSVSPRHELVLLNYKAINLCTPNQAFAGLNQTGDLDDTTVKLMNTPRCGVTDIVGKGATAREWMEEELGYNKRLGVSRSSRPTRI